MKARHSTSGRPRPISRLSPGCDSGPWKARSDRFGPFPPAHGKQPAQLELTHWWAALWVQDSTSETSSSPRKNRVSGQPSAVSIQIMLSSSRPQGRLKPELHRQPPRLLGLPYDGSSSYSRGAADAPPLIRAALRSPHWNLWSEQGFDIAQPVGLSDAGDLPLASEVEPRRGIERGIKELFDGGWRPLALGGDHSVTYPILRAVAKYSPSLTLLHVDAHPDLYHEYEGDLFSHACPFARIMEEGLAARLIQVGIRTMNAHQRSQADRFGVEMIDMRACQAGVRPRTDGAVYLSIDLDGLDPAFAPGVSHREPGGLSVREVLTLVQSIGGMLVGADVVEYNPSQDVAGLTATVAAKIVKEVAGRMLADTASDIAT